jgi:hypothetical protein
MREAVVSKTDSRKVGWERGMWIEIEPFHVEGQRPCRSYLVGIELFCRDPCELAPRTSRFRVPAGTDPPLRLLGNETVVPPRSVLYQRHGAVERSVCHLYYGTAENFLG